MHNLSDPNGVGVVDARSVSRSAGAMTEPSLTKGPKRNIGLACLPPGIFPHPEWQVGMWEFLEEETHRVTPDRLGEAFVESMGMCYGLSPPTVDEWELRINSTEKMLDLKQLGLKRPDSSKSQISVPSGIVVCYKGPANKTGKSPSLIYVRLRLIEKIHETWPRGYTCPIHFTLGDQEEYWDMPRPEGLLPPIFGLQLIRGSDVAVVCGDVLDARIARQDLGGEVDVLGVSPVLHDPELIRSLLPARYWFVIFRENEEGMAGAERWIEFPQTRFISMGGNPNLSGIAMGTLNLNRWLLDNMDPYVDWTKVFGGRPNEIESEEYFPC